MLKFLNPISDEIMCSLFRETSGTKKNRENILLYGVLIFSIKGFGLFGMWKLIGRKLCSKSFGNLN